MADVSRSFPVEAQLWKVASTPRRGNKVESSFLSVRRLSTSTLSNALFPKSGSPRRQSGSVTRDVARVFYILAKMAERLTRQKKRFPRCRLRRRTVYLVSTLTDDVESGTINSLQRHSSISHSRPCASRAIKTEQSAIFPRAIRRKRPWLALGIQEKTRNENASFTTRRLDAVNAFWSALRAGSCPVLSR